MHILVPQKKAALQNSRKPLWHPHTSWECLIHTAFPAKLSLSSSSDLLIQTSHHLLIHTDVTAFTWSSLSIVQLVRRPTGASGISDRCQAISHIGIALSLKHTWKFIWSNQLPSCWQLLIKIIQSSLNPGSGWTGNTPYQTHAHIHTSSIRPSKSQSPDSISNYASISLYYLDFMRYFSTFLQ